MRLERLTASTIVEGFDCGDRDLNDFLIQDAKAFSEKLIANTFVLKDENEIAAYFCLLNDKISRQDVTNSQWKKLKGAFPVQKQFGSYPAIKIGRFAVSKAYRGRNVGTDLMILLKEALQESTDYSAFRFLTVDAYMSALGFYEKNSFKILTKKIENDHTRLMYFDMLSFFSSAE